MPTRTPEREEPGPVPSGPGPGAAPEGRADTRLPMALCLLCGPLGLVSLDRRNFLPGLLALALFATAAWFAWPALLPAVLPAGFLLCALRARAWIRGESRAYSAGARPRFLSGSVPLFLPLLLDLALLTLLPALLRQAWLEWQRGSVTAALLTAFFSAPLLFAGTRALGKKLVRLALRPYRNPGPAPFQER